MPFDACPPQRDKTLVEANELIALLRNPSRWPAGFQWDYRFAYGCAWFLTNSGQEIEAIASGVFTKVAIWLGVRMQNVGPEDVANALEMYLLRGAIDCTKLRRARKTRLRQPFWAGLRRRLMPHQRSA